MIGAFFWAILIVFLLGVMWAIRSDIREKTKAKKALRSLCSERGWEFHVNAGPWYTRGRIAVWPEVSGDPVRIWWPSGSSTAKLHTFAQGKADFPCAFQAFPGPMRRIGPLVEPSDSAPTYTFSPRDPSQLGKVSTAMMTSCFGLLAPILSFRGTQLIANVPFRVVTESDLEQLVQGFCRIRTHLSDSSGTN